ATGPVEQLDCLADLTLAHPNHRLAGQGAHLELRQPCRQDCRAQVFERLDRLGVPPSLEQRLRTRQSGVDAASLVGRDTVRQKTCVDTEALCEPLDGLARRTCLPTLDLADVLLREAVARKVCLRHRGGDAKLPEPLTETQARLGESSPAMSGSGSRHVSGSRRHASQNFKWPLQASPKKGMIERFSCQPPYPRIT